ncbi:B3 domain-containing protein At2g31720-like [Glycine soja]|uniref:B3 domain-containing protein n=1 Tax=Glycine soja TaxID=3848 RepID=A0A445M1N9_GLYSO|nr:B3 domain-containing protein At2g31720-like [Glycine soja]RZC29490.1 B3 domain-containing protein [Glycine soja]
MRDLKTLKELVASVTDWKSLEKMSCKPFKPSILHLAISQDAPHLYSEEQLIQLKKLSKLLSSAESKPNTNKTDKRVTKKRQIEERPKEERVMPATIKKPRKIILEQNGPSPDLPPRRIILEHSGPSPDLPMQFKNRVAELSGHDLKYLMHKRLFWSDVKPNNNRLSMPINEIMCEFLTQAEIEKLDERNGSNRKGRLVGLELTVLDPCLREFTLPLKKWSMQRTDTYNLVTDWNSIVSTNEFEEGQELQIWSFRVDNKLYLLLNKL